MEKSKKYSVFVLKLGTFSQPALFCFELVSMQKLRKLKGIETKYCEFDAMVFVSDKKHIILLAK